MYVVNSFNVCGKSVSVFSTSTVYTVNPRFAFIRGGRFILSLVGMRNNERFINVKNAYVINILKTGKNTFSKQ